MTEKQATALSQLAYLDWPPGAITLGDFVREQRKILKSDPEKLERFEPYFQLVTNDEYLKNLKLVGYQNNNKTGTNSGFVGYAFEDATSSGDGVVSFRGSENPFEGNANDWINNIEMETHPDSAQMKDANAFMANTEEGKGVGNLKNIQAVGHSLGGYHAGTQAILDPRVTSATTFNAPGVSASFMAKNSSSMTKENLGKINAYAASGDLVSKLGFPLVSPKKVPGSFDIGAAHGMGNFKEGSGSMEDMGLEGLQEVLPEELAELLNLLASLGDGMNTFITETLPTFVETVTTFFSELPGKVGEFFDQVVTDITTWVNNLITTAQEEVPKFIESVKTFFSELPGKVGAFFDQVATDITTWVNNLITTAQEEVPKFIESVKTFFSELPGKAGAFFDQIITDIIIWVSNLITTAEEEVPKFIESVKTFFSELPGKAGEFFDQVVTDITTWATNLVTKAQEELPKFVNEVATRIGELPGKALTIGGDLVEGIFNGVSNKVEWLYGKLKGWVNNVVDYIKGLFGINSPSKLMRDTVGIGIAEGVAVGIEKNTDLVSAAMSDMADVVAASDLSVEPEVTAKALDFEAFKEKLRPSLDFVKTQLSHVQDVMTTQFTASAQLAAAKANDAVSNNTYNNQNYNYTVQSNGYSPKATADAIKNQQTLTRMLYA